MNANGFTTCTLNSWTHFPEYVLPLHNKTSAADVAPSLKVFNMASFIVLTQLQTEVRQPLYVYTIPQVLWNVQLCEEPPASKPLFLTQGRGESGCCILSYFTC